MSTQTTSTAARLPSTVKTQKPFSQRLAADFKNNWILYCMMLPALIYFTVKTFTVKAICCFAAAEIEKGKGRYK